MQERWRLTSKPEDDIAATSQRYRAKQFIAFWRETLMAPTIFDDKTCSYSSKYHSKDRAQVKIAAGFMEDAYSSHLQLAQRLNRHLGLWLGSLDLCVLVSSLHRLLPIAMKFQGIVSIVRMAIITFSKALAELETHRQRAAEYQHTMIVYVIVAPLKS